MVCRRLLVVSLLGAVACLGHGPRPTAGELDPRIERRYRPLQQPIRNPERGLAQAVKLTDPGDIEFVAGLGVSLASAHVRLDRFRSRPLSDDFLAELDRGFERIRAAGLSLVLRFQYNAGSGKDPALERVLAHIAQLAPLLRRHADVIAVVQAGFIGAWGEWHTSTSGLTEAAKRRAILGALLDALPAERSVQVRSPAFKEEAYPGGPLTRAVAHDGRPRSRIGHHNDCLLSGPSDHGTYPDPVDRWRDYLAADSWFVPVGGESCAPLPAGADCASALAELRRFHWSYLNRSYHPAVIRAWRDHGCFARIERDLGYRLVAARASWPRSARAGETIRIEVDLYNLGYAAPFNPRPVFVTIGDGPARRELAVAAVDPRDWRPGELHRISAELELPRDLPAGEQTIALWLPSASPALRTRPAYAIRLANAGLWRPERGDNRLGQLTVE